MNTSLTLKRLSVLLLVPAAIALLLVRAHPLPAAQTLPVSQSSATQAAPARLHSTQNRKRTLMADTTAPVPNTLTFSGTTFTLTMTETDSPPLLDKFSILVSGAGSAIANGRYQPTTIRVNGAVEYANGPEIIDYRGFYQGGVVWRIFDTTVPSGTSGELYDAPDNGQGQTQFPFSGWTTFSGIDPAPAFAGNFFTSAPITITGLSGGAVTVSNINTSGTTITGTMSRAIASAETGGTFNGAASAFSDSASPPNMTAAFSIPITSSMFSGAPSAPRNLAVAVVF